MKQIIIYVLLSILIIYGKFNILVSAEGSENISDNRRIIASDNSSMDSSTESDSIEGVGDITSNDDKPQFEPPITGDESSDLAQITSSEDNTLNQSSGSRELKALIAAIVGLFTLILSLFGKNDNTASDITNLTNTNYTNDDSNINNITNDTVDSNNTGFTSDTSAEDKPEEVNPEEVNSEEVNPEEVRPEEVTPVEPKGKIALFQHGYTSDDSSFSEAVNAIEANNSTFVEAGVITLKDTNNQIKFKPTEEYNKALAKYDISNSLPIKTQLKQLTDKGVNVMFKTGFSDTNGGTQKEIVELDKFIEYLTNDEQKVSLVGHSRGGLVSVGYAGYKDNAKNVDNIITISTPYEPSTPARISNLFGRDDGGIDDLAGQTPELANIRSSWNNLVKSKKAPRLDAIGVKYGLTNHLSIPGDGTVSLESQLGGDKDEAFLGVNKHISPEQSDHHNSNKIEAVSEEVENLLLGKYSEVSW